ncbi:hypothetical protein DSO57_1031517, partial [Entomophthora muscae]
MMVGIPVGASLVVFHPTVLLHYLGSLLSQECPWHPQAQKIVENSAMIFPIFKFVIFTLALVLLLIWSTSPELWGHISFSASLAEEDPSQFLSLLENLPGNLACALTCDSVEYAFTTDLLTGLQPEMDSLPCTVMVEDLPPVSDMPVIPGAGLNCSSWLVAGILLMGLNDYLPQLSPVVFIWTPVQVAIPVFHWVASWW